MVIGDVDALRASLNLPLLDAVAIVHDSGSISQEALLSMSRVDLKRCLTTTLETDRLSFRNVRSLLTALLATMRDSLVADTHLTAACNAICVFLQSASVSPGTSVRTLASSTEVWLSIFDALLDNFATGKTKPRRQVLNTLIKILQQQFDRESARAIQDIVLRRMAGVILTGKPSQHLKASMVIFEAFLRSTVPFSRALSAIGFCYASRFVEWKLRLDQGGSHVRKAYLQLKLRDFDESIFAFCLSIALALATNEAQATAGTFFVGICTLLSNHGMPVQQTWIEATVVTLQQYPDAVEAFKNYFLPSMLKIDKGAFRLLLQQMTSDDDPSMLHNALTITLLGRDADMLTERGKRPFAYANGLLVLRILSIAGDESYQC
jgi:hypothetical protein